MCERVRRPTCAGGGGALRGDDGGLAPCVAHRLAIRLYPRRGLHVAEALGEQCRNRLVQPSDTAADLGHRRAVDGFRSFVRSFVGHARSLATASPLSRLTSGPRAAKSAPSQLAPHPGEADAALDARSDGAVPGSWKQQIDGGRVGKVWVGSVSSGGSTV